MLAIKLITKIIAPELKAKKDLTQPTCFDFQQDTIFIGRDFNRDRFGFMEHLNRRHGCKWCSQFSYRFWALLHEIGHYETDHYAEETEEDFASRAVCAIVDVNIVIKNKQMAETYFNLPLEWEATEWAIDWVRKHPLLARIFNQLI